MEIFLYAVILLLFIAHYVKTRRRMNRIIDILARLSDEMADVQKRLEDEARVDIRDYEAAIQQGVENLMGYGVEVAMKGEQR